MSNETANRLEYLRGEIRAQRISYGELYELQSLAEFIDPGDVELLEWAGVPEFPEMTTVIVKYTFAVDVEDPTDKNAVTQAVREYIDAAGFALDEPDSIEVEAQ
jgi:hypothetical protein